MIIIKKYITTLLLIFLSLHLFSQEMGSLLLRNFTSEDYNADSQNWCITQDNRGILYIGNTQGLLEYDGVNWQHYFNSKNSVVRSLDIDEKGVIYTGGSGEFGYFKANKTGKLEYYNLTDSIKDKNIVFQDVWKVICSENSTYFFTNNEIFRYYQNEIQIIQIKTYPFFGNFIGDYIYIFNPLKGISYLKDTTITLLENTLDIVKKAGFVHILEHDDKNKLFIVTSNNGIFSYNLLTNDYEKIEIDFQDYLITNEAYSAVRIDVNLYGIGTSTGGILIFNGSGKLLNIINKNRGLQSNCIYYLMVDNEKNLWAGLQSGLSRIDISNPLIKFDEKQGIEDYILDAYLYNNRLILASMNYSLYLTDYILKLKDDNRKFNTFSYTGGIWDLFLFNNHLIGVGYNGVTEFKDTIAKNLSFKGDIIFCGNSLKKLPKFIFLGTKTGLAYLKTNDLDENQFLKVDTFAKFSEINEEIRYLTVDKEDNLWISTKYDGIYLLKFNSNQINDYELIKYDTDNGLDALKSIKAELINNEIKILTEKGIYKIVKPSEKNLHDSLITFVHDDIFGKTFSTDSSEISEVFQISENKFLFYSDKSEGIIDISSGEALIDSVFLKRIPSISRCQYDGNNKIFICTSNSLYIYDLNQEHTKIASFKTFIRKVTLNSDSIIFNGTFFTEKDNNYSVIQIQSENFIPILDYNSNSITFNFSSNFYEESDKTLYCFKLEGFDEDWSKWVSESKAVYTNIPAGKYIFKVKAKNIYENESEIAEYQFTIRPPWYKKWWAFIIWFILTGYLISIFVKINTIRLRNKNRKLENLIDERTKELKETNLLLKEKNEELQQQKEEILAQSEELQSQTEELQVINAELEKLSIVASETDNAVLIFDNNHNLEWINNAFYRLYGWSLEEIQYKSIQELSSNDNITEIVEICIKEKRSISYEALVLTKSKENIWIHTTITPIFDFDGRISKLIAVESNIHQLKLAQKEIGIQNKLITSSINYAVTIQNACLPLRSEIEQYFDYFVIFRPKDVVSGDFYWFTKCTIENKNVFFWALLDCTGHGVPGAFMSLIGNTLLNEIISEKKISETNEILDTLDKGIKKALRQDTTENIDGMDVALCRIEYQDDNKIKCDFSGAKQPLLYFSSIENELFKIKGVVRKIGGYEAKNNNFAFIKHELFLNKGDIIYLKSDGFEDQCDRDRKRFGKGKLKRMLSEIAKKPLNYQKNYLENELDTWQLEIAQRDDITILGIKL